TAHSQSLVELVHFILLLPSPPVLFLLHSTRSSEIYTLSLHDALPISCDTDRRVLRRACFPPAPTCTRPRRLHRRARHPGGNARRSEEHTSELQSRENLVCRLLLEKKK